MTVEIIAIRERKLSEDEARDIMEKWPQCPLCGTELESWNEEGIGICPAHGNVLWRVFDILGI